MPPPKAETDPAILAQRAERKRSRGRVNTANYRKRINDKVETLMGHALDGVLSGDPARADTATLHNPAQGSTATRTARAILKRTLRRYGLTLDKAARRLVEGLDSEKLRLLGDEIRSQPDTGNRLRSTDMLLKLLEKSGDLPGTKDAQIPQSITINITRYSGAEPQNVPLLAARTIDAPAVPAATTRPANARVAHAGSAKDEATQRANAPYELPGSQSEGVEEGEK